MDKELLVSNLYALRAGLSVISQEKRYIDEQFEDSEHQISDKREQVEAEMEQEWKRICTRNKNIKEEIEKQEKIYKEYRTRVFKTREEADRPLGKAKFVDFCGRLKIIFGIFLGVATILIGVLAIVYGIFIPVCYFSKNMGEGVLSFFEKSTKWVGGVEAAVDYSWMFIVGGIGLTALGIWGWVAKFFTECFLFDGYTRRVENILDARARLKDESGNLSAAEAKLKRARSDFKDSEREMREFEDINDDKVGEVEDEIKNDKAELIESLTPRYNATIVLYDGLDKTFGAILDKRDWENLDYIIFSLETGRADDMKEALQLVDKENQMQRLVQAINNANTQICRTINSGLARLQNDMRICFNTLANMVVKQNEAIMDSLYNISGQIASVSRQVANVSASVGNLSVDLGTVSEYVGELSSETRLNNALIQESNRTSAQLAADVSKLRTDSEYSGLRI